VPEVRYTLREVESGVEGLVGPNGATSVRIVGGQVISVVLLKGTLAVGSVKRTSGSDDGYDGDKS
jgi:hypothetical protein